MTIMVDCIGGNARKVLDHFGPRQPVACYANGPVSVWTPSEESWFGEKIRIGVYPGQPEQARVARCLDVERYDANPSDAPPFILARDSAGHDDATIYCDLSTLPEVIRRIRATFTQSWLRVPWRLWVAWYWDRGTPDGPDNLLTQMRGIVPPERVWAWQFAAPDAGLPGDAVWDESVVFGKLDWSR